MVFIFLGLEIDFHTVLEIDQNLMKICQTSNELVNWDYDYSVLLSAHREAFFLLTNLSQ